MHLRGTRHWQILGPQKSFKVKLDKGHLLEGHRTFNLINDPTPMLVGEEIVLDLARELDLLTPRSGFGRVSFNGADLGVFRFETQPDESLLRVQRRFPGSIYSGNLGGSAGPDRLWTDSKAWKKVAWATDEEKQDFSDLERLLQVLRQSTTREFVAFARSELDLERYATLDALDVLFGIDERNYRQNQKHYFDRYRGRYEPVVWAVRGFQHEAAFNLSESPLLLRLKTVPEYLSLRNRKVFELLNGAASIPAVRQRALALLRPLVPELASDPMWDAYKLLPRVSTYHRLMLRPMDVHRLGLDLEAAMAVLAERYDFLRAALEHHPLYLDTGPAAEGRLPLRVVIDGAAGVELTGFEAAWPETCPDPGWQILRGGAALGGEARGAELDLDPPLRLYPRVTFKERAIADANAGPVVAEPSPAAYDFELRASCVPESVRARGRALATGASVRSRPAGEGRSRRVAVEAESPDVVPAFEPGVPGPHPGALEEPAGERITLGPGVVAIEQTRVFGTHQAVEVPPGTTLRLAPGAALIFQGPVHFNGTGKAGILLEAAGETPWGGVALQGPGTAGSRLSHVAIRGGSAPRWGLIPYPAVLDIHDTRDVHLSDCRISGKGAVTEGIHAAYVRDLSLQDVRVEESGKDALDLEFVEGTLDGVTVAGAKDECLDAMGAQLSLRNSVLLSCGGNALSAGEESRVQVTDSLLARSGVGVLAKNASRVELGGSLLYGNGIGVRLYVKEKRFTGISRVSADVLVVVGSPEEIKTDEESTLGLEVGRIERRLTGRGTLEHLRGGVLGLSRWQELDAALDGIAGGRP
jgi:hypothetical protein